MKSRILNATQKRTPCFSTNFLRRTRNFRCPALHFLSFPDKPIFVRNRSHTGPRLHGRLNPFGIPIKRDDRGQKVGNWLCKRFCGVSKNDPEKNIFVGTGTPPYQKIFFSGSFFETPQNRLHNQLPTFCPLLPRLIGIPNGLSLPSSQFRSP